VIEEARLIAIVGADNIDRTGATLDAYSRDVSFASPVRPACVVKLHHAESIQKLVNLARETNSPLIPVSSGAPHFRGDTVPSIGGAIIVDLSGMKRIIHISRKHRMAMFEPGVTFGDLIPAVRKEGLRLNIPLAPRQFKSVLGSLLEREPVIMPIYHWDIGDPIGCTEIVFGNGELYRTGAAAGTGSVEEQWVAGGSQKEAAGPSSASWYRLIQGAQGTMGIVNWVTARCEVLPKLEVPYFVGASSLSQITEMLHWLVRLRLANECLVLNNINAAALMAQSTKEYQTLKETLPRWVLFFNTAAYDYFPEDRIDGQIEDMLAVTQRIGVEAVATLGRLAAADFLDVVRQPSAEPYWKTRVKGACEDIFFITVYDQLDAQIKAMFEAVDIVGLSASDIGIYLQPLVQGVNCHCEFNVFYNADNRSETDRVKRLSTLAIRSLTNQGAFFSRPYGPNVEAIMNRDAASVNALRKIKAITDPQNIMNPGKLCF
jgi:FAD/FMN-containing dehydrogenase